MKPAPPLWVLAVLIGVILLAPYVIELCGACIAHSLKGN